MKLKKIISMFLVVLMSLIIFTGCEGKTEQNQTDETNTQTEDSVKTDAKSGAKEQKLIYAMNSEPREMDPGMNYWLAPSNVLQNVFRGLYKLDVDGNLVPSMATGCTVDDTNTVYTFTMNPDAKWSDGSSLNAFDFEYSWKRVIDPAVGSQASYALFNIKNAEKAALGEVGLDEVGIKALDENTFQVTLEAPTSWFLSLTTTPNFMPVKKDVAEIQGWQLKPETYISNGPYMVTEMKTKEKYVLKKNPYYLDADNVKLDTIEIVFIESAESTLIAYDKGEVMFTENISAEAKEKYFGTEDYVTTPKIGLVYYTFNTNKAPFDDAKVRKAFSYSIDRQVIIESVIESLENPAFAFVPEGYYNPANTEQQFRDATGHKLFGENIEVAKKLLEEAGYKDGKGMPKIELCVGASQLEKDIAQALQGMWKETLGVSVDIVTFESKILNEEVEKGNYSITSDGWTGLYPDPMSILLPHVTGQTVSTYSFWSNAEYDSLSANSIVELDQQKRLEMFQRMEEIILDEMPVFPIHYRKNAYLCKPEAKNVIKNILGHTYLEYAYIE